MMGKMQGKDKRGGMGWAHRRLESLATDEPYAFVGGPFGSRLTSRDYTEEGVPVIRGNNHNNGRFLSMDNFVFVSDSKVHKELSSNLAKPGDLVFTQRGTLGQVSIIPENGISTRYVVSQSQMKMTPDKSRIDKFFLYYYFSNRQTVERILNLTSSSGVPHINLTILRKFKVPVPSLKVQKNIASILSAYDDLIENNRRRIQLLEQSARLLYKEWFVHLRFPGHEHTTITDGVLEGWEKKSLSELCTDIRESINPQTLPPKTAYIGLEHIPRHSITLNKWGSAAEVTSNKFKFAEKDILFGKIRPYFHKVGFAIVDGITSSDAIVIRPTKSNLYHYVLLLLSSDEFIALASKTVREGSKMPRADWKFLLESKFIAPSQKLLNLFSDNVAPICNQLQSIALYNRKLVQTRDLLLPRLMSGKITIC